MVNSLTLSSATEGNPKSPAIVILHGLFGSSANWRSIARTLSEDYFIVSLDLRNHGSSPWQDTMTYPEMAGDVALAIQQQCVGPVVILGHSMGGKTAMTLVDRHPELVRGLIVADIAPLPYSHSHDSFIEAMQSVDLGQVKSRTDVDSQLAQSISEAGIRSFLLQNLVREGDRYRWRINLDAIAAGLPDLLDYAQQNPSTGATVFIGGSESSYLDAAGVQAVRHWFPEARIDVIEDAGHWLHAEQPKAFISKVDDFVKQLPQ